MTDFVTRIELVEGVDWQYEALDQAMRGANFTTLVTSAQGVSYQMPKATYFSQSAALSARDVRDIAMAAASKTGLRYDIVTTAGEMAFFLHPAR